MTGKPAPQLVQRAFGGDGQNRFGDVNGSHAPSLGMAAMRKNAIESEVSIWLAPRKTLDIPPRARERNLVEYASRRTVTREALLLPESRAACEFQKAGNPVHDDPRSSTFTLELAHACRDRHLRLPDGNPVVRAAFGARLFPDADVAGEWL